MIRLPRDRLTPDRWTRACRLYRLVVAVTALLSVLAIATVLNLPVARSADFADTTPDGPPETPALGLAVPPDDLSWVTINPDQTPRRLPPAPAGQDWQQACSCRPPYVGQDSAWWRQCLCTPPSIASPDPQAPLSWLVQRATNPELRVRQTPL